MKAELERNLGEILAAWVDVVSRRPLRAVLAFALCGAAVFWFAATHLEPAPFGLTVQRRMDPSKEGECSSEPGYSE